ncbi:MAG TPA: ABC transporter permease [Cyclobacteriaceae bacterium]|mgnify:CR=1 FL=1|nr:ABC transporter permease [Cyclobacteriaceae bacterium]
MFRNYLLIATRSLYKNLGYTSINIFGLAIGLACCLLVTLYVRFELSYENFHENKESIYRYIPRGERDGQVSMQTMLPSGFGPLIAESFREVEMFTRFTDVNERPLIRKGDTFLDAKTLSAADKDFFKIFSFRLVQGDANTVLTRPGTIAVAKSVADKYFPNGDAVGQVIRYDNAYDYEITGVFEDVLANSHLQFTYLTTFETIAKMVQDQYGFPADQFLNSLDAWNYSTYFYIPNEKGLDALAKRIDKKFTEARKEAYNDKALGDWLQPLGEIHFTKGIKADTANGDKNYVYIFSAVALLILIIACFNFMNLSTARAMKRAKEVGLRKVMGAFRHQLIKQFLGETIVLVSISLVIGIILLELLVPLFNSLVGQHLEVVYLGGGSVIIYILIAGLLTGILAGSYPAFYLSSFVPAQVLKGHVGPSGNAGLRKILTVMQFGVAAFLMIGTLIVYQQMNFIQNKNLGFDKESIVYMNPPMALWDKKEVLKENLLANTSIKSVTFSNGTPGMETSTWQYDFPGLDIPKRSMNTMIVDYDYINTFGLEIVEGRNLSEEFATDSTEAYLINEAAAEELMLEKPLGTPIRALDGHPAGRIVGVVKDFHYRSLHRRIEPLVLRIDPRNMWCMSVKLSAGNLKSHLAVLEKEWKQLAPDYPFSYQFVDQTIDRQYKAEQNTGVLIGSFAALAIIIACLGLLGLTAFMTEQRKKEIGVRKVLGASVSGIIMLLSKDFSRLILIAFILVVPLAWYAMNQWLADFAYQVNISPFVFVGAGLVVLIIAFTSVFYQALKAAIVNPSETLRNE